MRKKYSIGFLILAILLIGLVVFVYQFSYHKAIRKLESQSRQPKEECYYIKAADGYVTVYMADEKTVFEYTTIRVQDLPEEIQKEVEGGKKVETVGQVYGFLENYSS